MIPAIETAPVLSLRPQEVEGLVDALYAYHAIYSPLFQRREQRQWSADYLRGLLLDIRRKAIEPMVLALHGADWNAIRAMQQFVSEGAGSVVYLGAAGNADGPVRSRLRRVNPPPLASQIGVPEPDATLLACLRAPPARVASR
jgi:hypothetical protein